MRVPTIVSQLYLLLSIETLTSCLAIYACSVSVLVPRRLVLITISTLKVFVHRLRVYVCGRYVDDRQIREEERI